METRLKKVLANEDTLLLMMFLGRANARDTKWMSCFHVAQTGKHLLRTQNVSEQNQKHFLCPRQMLRALANGETVVSATMCPQQCVLFCHGLNSQLYVTLLRWSLSRDARYKVYRRWHQLCDVAIPWELASKAETTTAQVIWLCASARLGRRLSKQQLNKNEKLTRGKLFLVVKYANSVSEVHVVADFLLASAP